MPQLNWVVCDLEHGGYVVYYHGLRLKHEPFAQRHAAIKYLERVTRGDIVPEYEL